MARFVLISALILVFGFVSAIPLRQSQSLVSSPWEEVNITYISQAADIRSETFLPRCFTLLSANVPTHVKVSSSSNALRNLRIITFSTPKCSYTTGMSEGRSAEKEFFQSNIIDDKPIQKDIDHLINGRQRTCSFKVEDAKTRPVTVVFLGIGNRKYSHTVVSSSPDCIPICYGTQWTEFAHTATVSDHQSVSLFADSCCKNHTGTVTDTSDIVHKTRQEPIVRSFMITNY